MRSMNSDLAKMHRNPLQLSLDEGDLFSDAMIETAERFILSSESQNPGGGTLRSMASGGPGSGSDFEQSATHSMSETAKSESLVPETQVLNGHCAGEWSLAWACPSYRVTAVDSKHALSPCAYHCRASLSQVMLLLAFLMLKGSGMGSHSREVSS